MFDETNLIGGFDAPLRPEDPLVVVGNMSKRFDNREYSFFVKNVCFAGPAMAIRSLPSVTSSALRQEVRACDYLSRYQVIADATLRAREVAVLEARSEVPPSPCFQ